MGGDGQALTNNRTLLGKSKLYVSADELKKGDSSIGVLTERERRIERWSHCALSLERLEFPAAFDLGGRIYSKQSVVNHLLGKKSRSTERDESNIKKLSDISEIRQEPIDGFIVCSVSGLSTSSGHGFCGFWSCGHVVASSATKSNSKDDATDECPVCGEKSFAVPLAVSPEDESKQRKKFHSLHRALRKRNRE